MYIYIYSGHAPRTCVFPANCRPAPEVATADADARCGAHTSCYRAVADGWGLGFGVWGFWVCSLAFRDCLGFRV